MRINLTPTRNKALVLVANFEMPIPQLNLASFGNINFSDLLNGTSNYLNNSLPLAKGWSGWTWPTGYGRPLLEWLQQPRK